MHEKWAFCSEMSCRGTNAHQNENRAVRQRFYARLDDGPGDWRGQTGKHPRDAALPAQRTGGAVQSEVFLNSGSGRARMIAMTSRQTGFT